MLRLAVIVLLLANAVTLAFNLGLLDRLVGRRSSDTEPERLARQVNPGAVEVLSPQAASAVLAAAAASAAAAAAPACLQAGPFFGADAAAAEKRLGELALHAEDWQAERGGKDGVYLIYMGRYADAEAVQRKQDELKRIHVSAEPLRQAPELQPGLTLGRFEAPEPAAAELASLAQRGVRTARVITLRAATPTLVLRVGAASPALRERLATLQMPGGLGFVACAPAAASAASAPASDAVAR